MRKYIFFTYAVTKIGGSQIYIRNKVNYLKSIGWEVDVFSYQDGNIYIEQLVEFKKGINKELQFPIMYFANKKRKRIFEKLFSTDNIGNHDEVVIESNSPGLATWGEYLASVLKCRHIVYLISEDYQTNLSMYNFLSFKNRRKELAAAHIETLHNIFNRYSNNVENSVLVSLKANCTNVVEDVYHPLLENINSNYITIGSIGRLEKPFLKSVLLELKKYFELHNQNQYNLILIGGAPNLLKFQRIYSAIFENQDNVNLFITGYIYPIPYKLIKLVDVYISSAGSATLSNRYGRPTISIDSQSFAPIGILGESTLKSTFASPNNKAYNLIDLLDQILSNKNQYTNTGTAPSIGQIPEYSSHMEFVEGVLITPEYFKFENIKNNFIVFVKKIIINTFGITTFECLSHLKSKLFFKK